MDGGSACGEKDVIRAVARHIALKLRLGRLEARRREAFSAYCKLGKASVFEKSDRLERLIAQQLAELKRLDAQIAELRRKLKR